MFSAPRLRPPASRRWLQNKRASPCPLPASEEGRGRGGSRLSTPRGAAAPPKVRPSPARLRGLPAQDACEQCADHPRVHSNPSDDTNTHPYAPSGLPLLVRRRHHKTRQQPRSGRTHARMGLSCAKKSMLTWCRPPPQTHQGSPRPERLSRRRAVCGIPHAAPQPARPPAPDDSATHQNCARVGRASENAFARRSRRAGGRRGGATAPRNVFSSTLPQTRGPTTRMRPGAVRRRAWPTRRGWEARIGFERLSR